MIAVDTNILVYAHRKDAPFHAKAAACVQRLAEGHEQWAIPWPCAHEFLAICTHPKIFKDPTPLPKALEQVQVWLLAPRLQLLAEEENYLDVFMHTLRASQVLGGRVHDARIAALCMSHAVTELWTADRDFGRFTRLETRNPLI